MPRFPSTTLAALLLLALLLAALAPQARASLADAQAFAAAFATGSGEQHSEQAARQEQGAATAPPLLSTGTDAADGPAPNEASLLPTTDTGTSSAVGEPERLADTLEAGSCPSADAAEPTEGGGAKAPPADDGSSEPQPSCAADLGALDSDAAPGDAAAATLHGDAGNEPAAEPACAAPAAPVPEASSPPPQAAPPAPTPSPTSVGDAVEAIGACTAPEYCEPGRRINLAAAADGASVLAVNSEARRAERCIDGDEDSFMKNDCGARKWLMLELSQVFRGSCVDIMFATCKYLLSVFFRMLMQLPLHCHLASDP